VRLFFLHEHPFKSSEVEAERREDLTASGQYRSELVEDDDEEDMQTDDLEEDREVYDDYDG